MPIGVNFSAETDRQVASRILKLAVSKVPQDPQYQLFLCRLKPISLISALLTFQFAPLNQDRTAIDHNGLTCTESFLHQKQEGLGNVMSFADSSHRQTLAHVFIELLPFC
jgi:hypothetical protein